MLIHQENYEAYMLDYLEGTLSPEYRAEMEVFLLAHPELKEELLALDELHLPEEESLSFDHKALLKADPRSEELPELERWLEEHKELRLPLEEIRYPHKQALKRKTSFTFRKSYYYWAAAASLALLLTALWINKPSVSETDPSSHLAQERSLENTKSPQAPLSPKAQDDSLDQASTPDRASQQPLPPTPQPLPEKHLAQLPEEIMPTPEIPSERKTSSLAPLQALTAFVYEAPQPLHLLPASPHAAQSIENPATPPIDYLLAADTFLDKIEKEISSQGSKRIARAQSRLLIAFNHTAHNLRRKSIAQRLEWEQKIQEINMKKQLAQNH